MKDLIRRKNMNFHESVLLVVFECWHFIHFAYFITYISYKCLDICKLVSSYPSFL